MTESIWRDGDKITIEKSSQGWKIEVLRGTTPDGMQGGIVGSPAYSHPSPDAALAALRRSLSGE